MFSFAGAKVRRFYATNQILEQESTKTFLFIDIYQQVLPFNGKFVTKTTVKPYSYPNNKNIY